MSLHANSLGFVESPFINVITQHILQFMPAILPCTCGTKAKSMQNYEVTGVSITKKLLV